MQSRCKLLGQDVEGSLARADSLILDLDGVLLDNFELYCTATMRTTRLLLETIVHSPLSDDLIPREAYYELKAKGRFNNDWDITFLITVFFLDRWGVDLRRALPQGLDLGQRLDAIRNVSLSRPRNTLSGDLMAYVRSVSEPSIEAIAKALGKAEQWVKSHYDLLVEPKKPGKGLIPTLLEEIYHGPLVDDIYGFKGLLGVERGLIEDEKMLVSDDDLRILETSFNGEMGILSGRPRKSAEYVLSGSLKYFKATVFMEEGGDKKPDPKPVLNLMEKLRSNNPVLVGDSGEDAKVKTELNKLGIRGVFVGVTSGYRWKQRLFTELGADIICTTLKDFVRLVKSLKRY